MANPFLGEVRMFGGNFAPRGWAVCEGQLLSISQNNALFALLGTTYGGNGTTTFALPDLRGRLPLHQGAGFVPGQKSGTEGEVITTGEIPAHSHPLQASSANSSLSTPIGNTIADTTVAGANIYGPLTGATPLAAAAVGTAGGNEPHENRMPFLCVNFIIALQGIFPSRN